MQHWLVKQEPEDYSWDRFVLDGGTAWTGVRNFQARNYLRAMAKGDLVLYYHSGTGKQVVGIAKVARKACPDPTAKEGDWSSVDLAPLKPLKLPVDLATIRADKTLAGMLLLRQSRLSVMPLSAKEFLEILKLAQTDL